LTTCPGRIPGTRLSSKISKVGMTNNRVSQIAAGASKAIGSSTLDIDHPELAGKRFGETGVGKVIKTANRETINVSHKPNLKVNPQASLKGFG
jgi:hypothetical protein